MHDDTNVSVQYQGNIKHPLFIPGARPIRTTERKSLHEIFARGQKPYSVYAERLRLKTGLQLVAGNFDGMGKSQAVLRKIASEKSHLKRLDDDVYQSLIQMKECNLAATKHRHGIRQFIQSITIEPIVLLFWTENGLRLWHELVCCNIAFLDATGSVVRKMPGCSRILYYELTIRNPIGGGSGVPIAAMLSSNQTVSVIGNFLQSFRDAEKRLYGFRNQVKPAVIKVDFAMALIMSLLRVFNQQDIAEYLKWCWHTMKLSESHKTIIHVCLGHLMKRVKGHCIKISKICKEIVMYTFSLIACASLLDDIAELFRDLCIVMCSPQQTEAFNASFCRLQTKIKLHESKALLDSLEGSDNVVVDENIVDDEPCRQTEEECANQCPTSPFLAWAGNIHASVLQAVKISKDKSCSNRFYCPAIIDKILHLYMPTLPLWSKVMFTSVQTSVKCRHQKQSDAPRMIDVPNTTGAQEQRFTIFKHLILSGRSTSRLDEFTAVLQELVEATEKEFVLNLLRKRPDKKKSNKRPVEEQWDKKQTQPPYLLNPKIGKYQQPAIKGIKNVNIQFNQKQRKSPCNANPDKLGTRHTRSTKQRAEHAENVDIKTTFELVKCTRTQLNNFVDRFCAMKNIGNSCWFNSAIQAFSATRIVGRLLECFSVHIDADDKTILQTVIVLDIFGHMQLKSPEPISEVTLRSCIEQYHKLFPGSHSQAGTQHDVHEFITNVLFDLFMTYDLLPTVTQ